MPGCRAAAKERREWTIEEVVAEPDQELGSAGDAEVRLGCPGCIHRVGGGRTALTTVSYSGRRLAFKMLRGT
jgi:hypothetical protein